MNSIVALPIVAALPTDAPSIVGDIPPSNVTPFKADSAALMLVERCHVGDRLWDAIADKLEEMEDAAREKFGRRPFELIAWRRYSAIGGSEIEGARDAFIREGLDKKMVRAEYRAAKKRERDAARAGEEWDEKAGLSTLRKAYDKCRRDTLAAWHALGTVPLQSIRDAAAILSILRARAERFDQLSEDWELAALKNATRFLMQHAG